MIKARNLGLLLALSSVAALPACSMFGGGSKESSNSSYSRQSYAAAQQPNYSLQSPSSSAQEPLTPDTIKQVQQTLRQDGMYHSRVDGVWGPASESALRSYQQQNNLNATGQLDQQTLASLNMGNNENVNQSYGNSQNPNNPNYGSNQQNPNNQGAQPMGSNQPNQSTQNAASNQQSGGANGSSSTH